ncbi:MAG: hypothetical protein J6T23_05930 [Elusimicrobia bacterium]|nr:hypothetical protein [Elusimicrobiota bacterium]
MNKDKILVFAASIVTLLLGPGAGHLVIKEWKRAIFFIVLALALFLILASTFISSVGQETLEAVANFQDIEQFKNIYSKFQEDNPNTMLIFNIFFAALWAYSILDLFRIARAKGAFKKEEK